MKISLGAWNNIFAVPATIVDDHIVKCGSVQLKVLLYLLRYPGREISIDELSEKLSLSTADINDSLNYWIAEKIISNNNLTLNNSNSEKSSSEDSNFQDPSEANQGSTQNNFFVSDFKSETPQILAPSAKKNLKLLKKIHELNEIDENNKIGNKIGNKVSDEMSETRKNCEPVAIAPRLTLKEALARINENSNFKFLIEEAPKILKRNLTSTDTIILISFMDWTGIDIDLALMIMNYCSLINKCSSKQIEQEAYRWLNNGIDTHEKAENFIKQNLNLIKLQQEVASAFHKPSLSEREKTFVKKWVEDFNYDIKIIKLAYERAIIRKGEKDFSYINGILFSWFKKGITKPEQVDDENQINTYQKNIARQDSKKQLHKSKNQNFYKLESSASFSLEDIKAKIKN